MKKIRSQRLTIRQTDGTIRIAATTKSGADVAGGIALRSDRQRQTFDTALRDTVELHRGALKKLAKR